MKLFQIEERQISDIVIEGLSREDLGDIKSLASSIELVGQLQPILIDSSNKLIDGFRRLSALKELKLAVVEVRVVDGISQDDHLMIELFSNLDRKEFIWHEEIALKYRLHNYWKNIAVQTESSWGYRETAKRLSCSLGGLSTDLAFAEAIKIFPELKEQSTKGRARELYKALGHQATAIHRMDNFSDAEKARLRELQSGQVEIIKKPIETIKMPVETIKASEVPKDIKLSDGTIKPAETKQAEPKLDNQSDDQPIDQPVVQPVARPINVIYVAENYKTFLDKIPDSSVGMVELDPPYAIGFNENYGKTNKIESKATDWDEKELYNFYFNYLPLIYQKMVDASWVLCWTGKEHYVEINKIAESIGFITQEPGSWVKDGGSTNQPKRRLVSNWEMYLLFRKGEAQFNTPSLPSSINIASGSAANRIHQWEKPIALYDHFLKALGQPGAIFLSPFAGSGNCLISAAKAKMVPIGCDKSQKYIPEFYQRLENFTGISADIEGL